MKQGRVWTVLDFGKHKGKTLPQIMFTDADWFFYAYSQGYFDNRGNLRLEADEIFKKATSIKIPQTGPERLVAEYVIHPNTENFEDMNIIPASRRPQQGSTHVFRKNVIDMSVPKQLQNHDKFGCKIMISLIKFFILGDTKYKMTKGRCEDFFSNNNNFEL